MPDDQKDLNQYFPITDIDALRLLANAWLLEEVVRRANLFKPSPFDGAIGQYYTKGATWND